MNKKDLFSKIAVIAIIIACYFYSNHMTNDNVEENDVIEETCKINGAEQILSVLKQNADIATTEVKIKKIVIYDTSKTEKFVLTDLSTWKYGDKKCIIPIEVTIKYGYDIRDLTIDNIKLENDSNAVVVFLPQPKIIDAGYNTNIEEGSVTSISTGLRTEVGHELQEKLRKEGYKSVMKEDLTSIVGKDVENNTRILFENLIKSLGWNDVQIITYNK